MRRAGLSTREVQAFGGEERRDALAQDWGDWLGPDWLPVPIPNGLPAPELFVTEFDLDVLILTGGNDLERRVSGKGDRSPRRDRTESALLKAAIDERVPVFAVCRGLHFVNRYFGGNTTADLVEHEVPCHVRTEHSVRLLPPVSDWMTMGRLQVNSYHEQGVFRNQLASELLGFAVSEEDELVEGLIHPSLPIVAVQWHPERCHPPIAFDLKLFEDLVADQLPWLS